jgi:hypothetical protein
MIVVSTRQLQRQITVACFPALRLARALRLASVPMAMLLSAMQRLTKVVVSELKLSVGHELEGWWVLVFFRAALTAGQTLLMPMALLLLATAPIKMEIPQQ